MSYQRFFSTFYLRVLIVTILLSLGIIQRSGHLKILLLFTLNKDKSSSSTSAYWFSNTCCFYTYFLFEFIVFKKKKNVLKNDRELLQIECRA